MYTSSPAAATVSSTMAEAEVTRRLTQFLREISAKKVILVSLSTLRNLMNTSNSLRNDMAAAGLVGVLESLCLPVILVKGCSSRWRAAEWEG